jgi:hypothetical protein
LAWYKKIENISWSVLIINQLKHNQVMSSDD